MTFQLTNVRYSEFIFFEPIFYERIVHVLEEWLNTESKCTYSAIAIEDIEESYRQYHYELLFDYAILSEAARDGYDVEREILDDGIYKMNREYLIDTWESHRENFYKDIIEALVVNRYFIVYDEYGTITPVRYNSPLQNVW